MTTRSGKMLRFGVFASRDSLIWSSTMLWRIKSVMQSLQRNKQRRLQRQRHLQKQQVGFFRLWDSEVWRDRFGARISQQMSKTKSKMHLQSDQEAKRLNQDPIVPLRPKRKLGSIRHRNPRVKQWGSQRFLLKTSSSILRASSFVTSST